MTRYDHRHWLLAVGMSAVAGYVDASGFLKLGGLFVSFMSGNSTRLGVGFVRNPHVAAIAALLILAFAIGVVVGALLATVSGPYRKPALLAFVGTMLALAGALDATLPITAVTMPMTFAMGAANTVFQRDGKVSIGVTYMTGTLVKFGQRLAVALLGGLVVGTATGSLAWPYWGLRGLCGAGAAFWILALYAALLDQRDTNRRPMT